MSRKKILIIMDGFFPGKNYGGPPVSVDNFCSLMSDYDIYIVARDHDLNSTEKYAGISDGWNKRSNCSVRYLSDAKYNYGSFKEIINEIKPDFLYLQSLFQSCVASCLLIAKKNNIKTILAPRGELCGGAFKKKYKKIPYIRILRLLGHTKNVVFQSTSSEESENIKKFLNAKNDNVCLLTNIPSFPDDSLVAKVKKSGSASFIFLSRIHPKKNLKAAVSYFSNIKGKVDFDIYGPLEDPAYWDECMEEIKKLPDNINVNYRGLVSHEDIHKTFNKYDAFVFPTLSENYGHVIAEALFSFCPVIISDQTPWNDVADYNAGFSLSLDDKDGFASAIQSVVDSDNNELGKNARRFVSDKSQIDSLRNAYMRLFSL